MDRIPNLMDIVVRVYTTLCVLESPTSVYTTMQVIESLASNLASTILNEAGPLWSKLLRLSRGSGCVKVYAE